MAHTEQQRAEMRLERERLQELLESYESGRVTHLDEDERGELKRDVTAERIASVKARIDDLDRTISERWGDD